MNDEIKEKKTKRIIEKIEGLATYVTIPRELAIYNVNIDSQEAKLLIDCITNLQQKVEYLERSNNRREDTIMSLRDEIVELETENERLKLEKDTKSVSEIICENLHDVYKRRCEEASKIIKEIFEDENWYKNYEYNNLEDALKEVDKILNGRSDE